MSRIHTSSKQGRSSDQQTWRQGFELSSGTPRESTLMLGRFRRYSQLQHGLRCCTAFQQQQHHQPDASLPDPLLWHSGRIADLKDCGVQVWRTCDRCPDHYVPGWEAQMYQRSLGTLQVVTQFSAQHAELSGSQKRTSARGFISSLQHPSELQQHGRRHYTTAQQQPQQQEADLSLLTPALQEQWHPVRNAHLQGKLIKPFSNRKVWWTCDQCLDGHPHDWEARVFSRSQGNGCPYCARRAVCPHNSLATKAPEVAARWSDCNHSTPHDYAVFSNQKVWWQCSQGHEWMTSIKDRTKKHSGCPRCDDQSKVGKKLQRHPTLTQSHHPMTQFWDSQANAAAGLDPSKITCRSMKRTHWICHKGPGGPHRWQATVSLNTCC